MLHDETPHHLLRMTVPPGRHCRGYAGGRRFKPTSSWQQIRRLSQKKMWTSLHMRMFFHAKLTVQVILTDEQHQVTDEERQGQPNASHKPT